MKIKQKLINKEKFVQQSHKLHKEKEEDCPLCQSKEQEWEERIVRKILACFKRGGKLLICGNGGSASQSDHFAAEFVCKYARNRKPLPAISLCGNEAIITAIANDFGYRFVFSRQIEAIGREGDVLITLSTSGRSPNILKAQRVAEALGMEVIDFPRRGKEVGDIQNYQLQLMHEICKLVENAIIDG